jgi:hypothetical protein
MQPTTAGFYDDSIPDENLVHSLEHGYIILWYDCGQVAEAECDIIKAGLRNVVEETGTYKVVAMPRESMDAPIIAVSWGVMYKQEDLDEDLLVAFVETNREKAPEPNAP